MRHTLPTLYFLYLITISTFWGCQTISKKEAHSLTIVDVLNGGDPLNPGFYENYNSQFICTIGFQIFGDSITYYKNYKNNRYLLKKYLTDDRRIELIGIIENVFTKPDRGKFGNKEGINENRIYCGPTYIPIIEKDGATKLNFVSESMPDIPYLDSMFSQFANNRFLPNENWIKLNDNQFIPFVLYAEQYANLQNPFAELLKKPPAQFIPPNVK